MEDQYINAEKYVLGSILSDSNCLDMVRETVRPEMFHNGINRAMFECACELQDEGQAVDIATVGHRFQENGGKLSGEYIYDIQQAAVIASDVQAYCDILVKESMRLDMMQSLSARLRDLEMGSEPREIAIDVTTEMDSLSNGQSDSRAATFEETFGEMLDSIIETQAGRKARSVKCGLPSLDRILGGGMQGNGLYILAARPGKGKTAFALAIARRVAEQGVRTVFVSLEMDREQLMSRIVAADIGGVSATTILNGTYGQETSDRIVECGTRLRKIPLMFNRQKSMNLKDIRYIAKVSKAQFVVIDYLGLIADENANGKLYEETTKKSKQLKQMARELECPILCLAQLNRELEKRNSKKPMLSDLRDSGSIEQDADAVMFNWVEDDTEDYELPEDATSDPVELKLVVAKNRHGSVGVLPMYWDKLSGRITELQKDSDLVGRVPF